MALLAAKPPPGDGHFAAGAMLCVGAKVAHAGHLYYNEGVDARHRPGSFAATTPPYTSPHNPLKEENELMDDKLRLKLVQLATEGYPKFRASDFEFHLDRKSVV